MKNVLLVMTMLVLSSVACSGQTPKAPIKELKTPDEKLSYAIGLEIGTSLKNLPAEIDFAVLVRAVEDGLKGKEPLLTQQEALKIKQEFGKKVHEERTRKRMELAEKNRKDGEAFLAENKKKEGVVTTESGLQYVVLNEGEGPKPKATDRVKVHYRGTLIDGTEFDSSYKRDKPATFSLKGVVAGWTEALQLMKVGSKYRLFIPSELAYGHRGRGPTIGPNAVLIFELELLEIEEKPVGPGTAPKTDAKSKK
jgi:FKBP-type peptidyl-prolyl cis-trans isomerase FkpA